MRDAIARSWKTTLAGVCLGGGLMLDAVAESLASGTAVSWRRAAVGLAVALIGLLAKDADLDSFDPEMRATLRRINHRVSRLGPGEPD